MINKVLGTNYRAYMRCAVPLEKFGGDGIAWFVYMDGKPHGPHRDYMWVNKISEDGTEIVETCVSFDKSYVQMVAEQHHNVLAFQLDPRGVGDRYECKFVGYFKQVSYDRENLIRVFKLLETQYTLR